jgi:hypothetical protein
MVESGPQEQGSGDDPGTRLSRLEAQIAKARRQLASLRHDGERHFIDDGPVHPEVPSVLADIVNRGDELARLRSGGTGPAPVNPAFSTVELDDQHRRLDELQARIDRLAQLCGDDPHSHERHFIDG